MKGKLKKLKKKNIFLVSTLILVSIALVVSVVLGLSGNFFIGLNAVESEIGLGEDVVIQAPLSGSNVLSFTFKDNYLPNKEIMQNIAVKANFEQKENYLVRLKLMASSKNGKIYNVDFSFNENWVKGEKYIYYKGILEPKKTLDAVTKLVIPSDMVKDSENKIISINLVVETVKDDAIGIESMWSEAPEDWLAEFVLSEG